MFWTLGLLRPGRGALGPAPGACGLGLFGLLGLLASRFWLGWLFRDGLARLLLRELLGWSNSLPIWRMAASLRPSRSMEFCCRRVPRRYWSWGLPALSCLRPNRGEAA